MNVTNVRTPIFLTGISGFIGSRLAERLLQEGFSVRGLARQPETMSALAAQGAEIVAGDVLDPISLSKAMEGCRTVVHAAAWTVAHSGVSSELAWRTNVEGTINMLAAARAVGVERFLHVSSIAVYGLAQGPLIDENIIALPVGHPYPDSKIVAEVAVKASGLPFIIIRPSHVYGPHDVWSLKILEQIRQGRVTLQKKEEGLVTTVYIENLLDAILLILIKEDVVNQTFNICDKQAVTYRKFYQSYAQMLGLSELPTMPAWRVTLSRTKFFGFLREILGRPSPDRWSFHVRYHPLHYSIERAERVLGYTPKIDFVDGMCRTETWIRSNGNLS